MNLITQIIAAVEQLTPDQRRQLQRRLRASGLFVPDEMLTDKNKLTAATAVRRSQLEPKSPNLPPLRGAALSETKTVYQAPVSGRVVIGAPKSSDATSAPHAMPPLPSLAPEEPIHIVFDGGSKGNPGEGYGSYQLQWPGASAQIVRLHFGDKVTNNEAEYDTLIAALEAVLKRLKEQRADPSSAQVDIRGDSKIVINQVLGEWKCNEERLQLRRDRARELLTHFGRWRLSYHERNHSVKALGH
jgi:ribonuclease HI